MIGCVGKDQFGNVALNRLQSSGVNIRHVERHPDRPTGTAFVSYAKDGSRSFIFNIQHSAAGFVTVDQLNPALFSDCLFFHVMGSSLISNQITQAIYTGIDLAKAAGGEISFDPNVRNEFLCNPAVGEAIHKILTQTDILLPSEDDLRYLFPEVPAREAANRLLSGGMRLVLLKRGKDGSTYFDRERQINVPPLVAEEVDPTGAGDCFGGTFISCLAQGIPLQRALELANAAGSLAVRVVGPMEGNSTLEQISRCLES